MAIQVVNAIVAAAENVASVGSIPNGTIDVRANGVERLHVL
jgi:hypothetical protein